MNNRELLTNYVYGATMPNDKGIEEAVLGALIQDASAWDAIVGILSSKSFYTSKHQIIFSAIESVKRSGHAVDLLTVTNQIRKDGNEKIVEPYAVVEITNRVASAANIEHHARILQQLQLKREGIFLGEQLKAKGLDFSIDALEYVEEIQKGVGLLVNGLYNGQVKPVARQIPAFIKKIEEQRNRTEDILGISTGLTALDEILTGLRSPDLIVIAARPGMGKTALTLKFAMEAAQQQNKPVAVFSLEMSTDQLISRLVSIDAELPGPAIRDPKRMSEATYAKFLQSVERVSDMPIFIDDTPGINIFELRAKCRKLKKSNDIQLVIVDYIQLMSGSGQERNREQEIAKISRSLKEVAKELDVPVIALSQLSRSVEARGGAKRPMLSDLRESGSIEQDADVVAFIYRPEYYQISEDEAGNSTNGIAELIIAKNRHGPIETVTVEFIKQRAEFRDFEEAPF